MTAFRGRSASIGEFGALIPFLKTLMSFKKEQALLINKNFDQAWLNITMSPPMTTPQLLVPPAPPSPSTQNPLPSPMGDVTPPTPSPDRQRFYVEALSCMDENQTYVCFGE